MLLVASFGLILSNQPSHTLRFPEKNTSDDFDTSGKVAHPSYAL
jgi:hypothetical protein